MGMEFKEAFDPFRALRHGFEALKREPAPVLIGGLLLFVLDACSGGGGNGNIPTETGSSGMDEAMIALVVGMMLFGCCMGIFVFIAKAFIEPGTWRVGQRLTQDGASGLDTLFSGKDVWLSMMGYALIKGLIGLGVFMVTALPGAAIIGVAVAMADGGEPEVALLVAGGLLIAVIAVPVLLYVQLGLQLGNLFISLDECKAMDALDRSWTLAKGNRLQLLWFDIVTALVMLAGLMMCCVGMIPARGIVFCATSNAFLLHTRDDYESFALVQELGAY